MSLAKDLRELLELFLSHKVDFVVVGALAMAHHGKPRFTGDLDLLVRPTAENATRVMQALRAFGFGDVGVSETDFLTEGQTVQLGHRPVRVDLLTAITGVSNDEIWATKVGGVLDGKPVFFIGLDPLKENKRATGRPKDLVDLAELEALENR